MREQEELHRNLGTANRFSHQQQANEDAAGLRALLEQGDLLEEELKKEKQTKMELEKEVHKMIFKFWTKILQQPLLRSMISDLSYIIVCS